MGQESQNVPAFSRMKSCTGTKSLAHLLVVTSTRLDLASDN
jgi:hypothetical protein